MNRQHAFTLVELLVTLAVLAFALMIAVPSFTSLSRSNRTVSETNALIGALNLARSEAAKRNINVSVCTSNDGATCAQGIGWNDGWIVFEDGNTQGTVDGGDTVLRVFGKLSQANQISPSAALANFITYKPDGFSTAQGHFILCDDSGTASARDISVSRTGRITLSTGGGTCNAP
jgi:type IV fimbrial biogenesis protein FimT